MARKKIIAIDFDNTIVFSEYPEIIGLKPNAKEVIEKLKKTYTIIINSCRACPHDMVAYSFLKDNDIEFDWFNHNDPDQIKYFGTDTRKISADIYIDDKNLGGIPDDWNKIYLVIKKWEEIEKTKDLLKLFG